MGTIEELSRTEGRKAAAAHRNRNRIFRAAWILSCILCVVITWAVDTPWLRHSLQLLWPVSLAAIFTLNRKSFNSLYYILDEECDPYKAEEAFASLYAGRGRPDGKTALYIILCMCICHQGDAGRALSMLNQIDIRSLEGQRRYRNMTFLYYDVVRMCTKDPDGLRALRQKFEELGRISQGSRFRKLAEVELILTDLEISLRENRLDVYDRVSSQEGWFKGKKIQLVAYRLVDARAYIMRGELQLAEQSCRYVIENGNRLQYVDRARELLAEIEKLK